MKESPEQRALNASTVALLVALACVALFIPPLVDRTVATPLRTALTGLALACALLLHCVYLGLGARRMDRSATAWVGLTVLLFPVGSAAALILLTGSIGDSRAPATANHG